MAETSEKKWYVLHTYSGYENKVKTNLESRAQSMGMEDYIFRVVVPEEEKHETTKTGKEKIETLKTFPGYVLVEMVMTDQSWYVVRNTPGLPDLLVLTVQEASQHHYWIQKSKRFYMALA